MTICLSARVALLYLEQRVGWRKKHRLNSKPWTKRMVKRERSKLNSRSYLEGAFSFSADFKKNLNHQGDAYLPSKNIRLPWEILLQKYHLLT